MDIIDELRPETPDLDPHWTMETKRHILRTGRSVDPAARNRAARLARVALVAATIAVLVGGVVAARTFLPPSDIRPAAPLSETVQRIDPSTATTLRLGDTLPVVADLPQTYDGDPTYFSAFADDDVVVGSATPKAAEQAFAPVSTQSRPVMYDLRTKTFTLLDDRARPQPTSVFDVGGNATAVVWAESSATTIDVSDFVIYAYDRRTARVHELARFDDPDGQIVYGGGLDVIGGTAYFSTAAYPAKRGQEAVYAVPVDGSTSPRVIAQGGEESAVDGDTVTYRVRNAQDDAVYPTYYVYDASTGKTTALPTSTHTGEIGFCGAEFTKGFETWCTGQLHSDDTSQQGHLTIKEASGRVTQVGAFPVSSENGPIPHDVVSLGPWTAVAISDGGHDRDFLIDLDTKKVRAFPSNTMIKSLTSDRSTALISSFVSGGPGPQRVVRIPGAS